MRCIRCLLLLLACCWRLTALADDALPPPVAHALREAGIDTRAAALWVQDVEGKAPRLAVNARLALNPASLMKLVTTHAALELLGPAFAWKTELLVDAPPVDGVLAGDLYLRGSGDPKLTYEQFGRLLRELRNRGVRDIRGRLVLDRSAFALDDSDPSRFDGQPMRPYNVAPDALLLNFKAISIRLLPDAATRRIELTSEPGLENLELANQLRWGNGGPCGDWRGNLRADLFAHANVNRLVLTGAYPAACGEQRWNIAVLEHPTYVLGVFRQLWRELGGSFSGDMALGTTPASARPLAELWSPAMAEVVRDINKFSNNVMARQLLLTLGLEAGRVPARVDDGIAAVRGLLEARGLSFPELVIENGSGLSRQERISADSLGRLLLAAWKSPLMPEFIASLPLVATDGTMKRRLKQNGVAGQAHIKTGSLEGVRGIAGYVQDAQGHRSAVVFIINHANASAAQPAQDALLQWLYASRP